MTRYGRDFYNVVRAVGFGKPLSWPKPKSLTPWGRLVFVNSWSDFFIEEADAWRDEAWEVIRRTPWNTYQILTKRPERIAERIADHLPKTCFKCGGLYRGPLYESGMWCGCAAGDGVPWPWPNVWLGTSVENQRWAEKRIPQLVAVPAVVHFLSCEPLLGPIDFFHPPVLDRTKQADLLDDIKWVIAGGESDPKNPRPMDLDWARSIRDQCAVANIPFFFKQVGGKHRGMCSHEDCRLTWGCKRLDGNLHQMFPSPPKGVEFAGFWTK